MNRQIKFRVWHESKMYCFNKGDALMLCFFSEGIPWGVYNSSTDERLVTGDPNAIFNKPGILMQFTGLRDDLGNDLYEGDVIEFDCEEMGTEKGIVRFSDGGFWTSQPKGMDEQLLSDELHQLKNKKIGDVYSNPELLTP